MQIIKNQLDYSEKEAIMEFSIPHDPIILLGMINMKLRDFYPNMESLCEDLGVDIIEVTQTLLDAGFKYDFTTNQFHQI
jgi:hypothetical protein